MTTTTEKYIKKAIQEAKKQFGGHILNGVNVTMNNTADGATQILAEALLEQSKANALNSEAMMKLASSLKPIDICGIKMLSDDLRVGNDNGRL